MRLYFISFCNDAQFLGGCFVYADDEGDAVSVSTMRGLNPGGEALVFDAEPIIHQVEPHMPDIINRLLDIEELNVRIGGKLYGELNPEQQAAVDSYGPVSLSQD